MTMKLPPTAAYVRSIDDHDPAAAIGHNYDLARSGPREAAKERQEG
jgi:hypothetical protein